MTETDKQMLPEVAAYFTEFEAAQDEWDDRHTELAVMYQHRYVWGSTEQRQQHEAYTCQYDEYEARFHSRRDEALATLRKATDPLVKWIATNTLTTYPDESEAVLKALPATAQELEELAQHEGWCNRFNQLWDSAVEAGVLVDPLPPVERELRRWMQSNVASYKHDDMLDLIDRVSAERASAPSHPSA